MTKFLLTAALVASANAFAPASKTSTSSSTSLNEFVRGYVGGEGPEPMPFSSQQTSVNWDPFDLAGVSGIILVENSSSVGGERSMEKVSEESDSAPMHAFSHRFVPPFLTIACSRMGPMVP